MGTLAAVSNWFGPEWEEDFLTQCKGDIVVVSGKVRGGDLSEGNLGCSCVSLEIGDPVFLNLFSVLATMRKSRLSNSRTKMTWWTQQTLDLARMKRQPRPVDAPGKSWCRKPLKALN